MSEKKEYVADGETSVHRPIGNTLDAHPCDLCGVVCPTASQMLEHVNGKKHQRNVRYGEAGGQPHRYSCRVCNPAAELGRRQDLDDHLRGRNPLSLHRCQSAFMRGLVRMDYCHLCHCVVCDSVAVHLRSRRHVSTMRSRGVPDRGREWIHYNFTYPLPLLPGQDVHASTVTDLVAVIAKYGPMIHAASS
jgi:hypothetical protein